jgi:hypothetical protein
MTPGERAKPAARHARMFLSAEGGGSTGSC